MCYNIKAIQETQIKRAVNKNNTQIIDKIKKDIIPATNLPFYHVSGFSHPNLLIYTNDFPDIPLIAKWGLVPKWIKDTQAKQKLWNSTLNARGETIFEKPSFKDSAINKRCVIYIDGFYEHQHINNKTYPYYIYPKNSDVMMLGGLWSEWLNPENMQKEISFTIVTTRANELMKEIHNNPKLPEARMPLILNEETEELWLSNKMAENQIQELIMPFPAQDLQSHTVRKLKGKDYPGNIAQISDKWIYNELNILF